MIVDDNLSDVIAREFAGPWRDDVPVFGCCRSAVTIAMSLVDVPHLLEQLAGDRVMALSAAVSEVYPDQISTHLCCARHIANLAFDLDDLAEAVASP